MADYKGISSIMDSMSVCHGRVGVHSCSLASRLGLNLSVVCDLLVGGVFVCVICVFFYLGPLSLSIVVPVR
jgi:hypothetical protein